MGGYAVGGYAVGGYAVGGYAVGGYVVGGYAVGGYEVGGYAVGGYAVGGSTPGNGHLCSLMHGSVDHWQSSVVVLVLQHDQPSNALNRAPFGAGGGLPSGTILCFPLPTVSCLPSTPVPPRWPSIGVSREMALGSQHSISEKCAPLTS